MNWIRGYYRLCLAFATVGLGGTLIVLTSWIPLKIKKYRLGFWILWGVVRVLMAILNVQVVCEKEELLRQHEGFIFPNHLSYLDILVLVYVLPVRFVAKAEVKTWPVIGLAATAIGCVFVKREDKASRKAAREKLAHVDRFPPVVLFPEGKRGPGTELLPLRYGAFEIAVQGEVPFVPCAIVYDPMEIAIWRRGEHVLKAIWRLVSRSGPVRAELVVLDVVQPKPDDDPVALANGTHEVITAVLQAKQDNLLPHKIPHE
ncbi:MAG: 1-acyl-sn-glycerol-3-phosphate acyltransferase [Chloroflexi bacterium]|nr:MAG: 1-acyl-sn-glycerol-3-phosphate acyltransferase [Chloroflexota bacterium]